jgi:hypothetical protein
MASDTIWKIQKSSIFGAGRYRPTPKIEILVLGAYVNRHEKSVFKNKKTPEPRSRPMRSRSELSIVRLPLVDAVASRHQGTSHGGGRRGEVAVVMLTPCRSQCHCHSHRHQPRRDLAGWLHQAKWLPLRQAGVTTLL